MSAHLSNEIVERFQAQSLVAGDRTTIYEHIIACESCRRRVVDPKTEAAALAALTSHLLGQHIDEPHHLDYETIEALVDDKLTVAETNEANVHLRDCTECSAEAEDLRASLATMKAASAVQTQGRQSIWQRLFASTQFRPIQIYAFVGVVAVLIVAGLLVWRLRSAGPEQPGTKRDITAGSQPTPIPSPQSKAPNSVPSPSVESGAPKLAGNTPPKNNQKSALLATALTDGANRIAIDQSGNLVGLESLPASSRAAVKDALAREAIKRPEVLNDLVSPDVSLRGSTSADELVRIVYPAKTVIAENSPTLQWLPAKAAKAYRIEISDAAFRQIAKSEDLPPTASKWTSSAALKPGMVYTWTIRAVKDNGEVSDLVSEGKFKVLDADKVKVVNRIKASNSHLALGVFYSQEGMMKQAEHEFEALRKENPNSPITKRFLSDVRTFSRQR